MSLKLILSDRTAFTVVLCLIACFAVDGTIIAGLPVATFTGAFDILQLYCTGAMTATKSTTSVAFVSSLVSTSSGNSIYSVFAANGYAAMLGPVGTMLLQNMYAGTAMSSGKMVAFAPLVQDFDATSVNKFITNNNVPQVYFTLPLDTVQTAALMLFFSKMEQFASTTVMLECNGTHGISQAGWSFYSKAVTLFGGTFFGTYFYGGFTDSLYVTDVQATKSSFILYAAPINVPSEAAMMQQYMRRTFTDPVQVERNATVVLTFAAGYLAWSQYRNAGSTKINPTNIITVAPVPGMDSTEYAASQAFAELRKVNFASVSGNNDLNYVMTGWMSGMTLIQALAMLSTNSFNSNGAMDNFYNNIGAGQSNFLVYDMVTGPLGTTCPSMAITQGVSCCQTGGRNLFLFQMKQMAGSYDWSLMDDVYTYPSGDCANIPYNSWSISNTALIPVPYHVFGQAPTDNDMMTYMCGQVQAVTRAMANTTLYRLVSDHPYRMYCQTTTMSSAATDLTNFEEFFQVKALSGAVADALVGSKTTGFTLDFIPQTTQPALTASNLFYLFPTLEQELYQMAVYLYTLATSPTEVCGVIQTSTSSTAIKTLLTNTLSTFSLPFSASNVVVVTSGTLAGSIPSGCTDTFVIGIEDGDVAALVSYLQEQSLSSVYISFDDLTKYYDQFQSQSSLQKASGLTSRLVFATNLPSWTATPSASSSATMSGLTTYEDFLQSVDTSLHTPAALRTFFVVSMFGFITAGSSPSLPNLQTTMYTKSVLSIGGLTFGPYLSSGATLSGELSSSTSKNYGAQEIGVWSYSRVVDPRTPLLMQPSTPSLMHKTSGATVVGEAIEGDAMGISESRVHCNNYAGGSSSTPDETTVHSSSNSLRSSRSSSSLSSPTTAAPTVGESSDSSETKSNSETLDILMLVLGIVCAVVWTVVLLVWLWPSVYRAVSRLKWFSRNPLSEIDSVCGREQSKEVNLRQKSCDATRAPSAGSSATLVVVDMPGVCQRWSCTPEAMRRDHVRYYRIVRQAIVEHVCYEVRAVSGTLMIACPSARVAIALVGCVVKHCVDAGLTRIRMAVLTASCASSVYVGGRGWWCGDEVAHTILSMCGLAAVGQILVSKSTLSGLDEAEVAATGAVPYEGQSLKADVPVELYDLPLLTGPSEPDHPLLARRSTALMIATVERGQSCHVEKTVKVVKDVMYFHYQIVGADVRCMDVMRLCGGFAPGEEATTTDDRCLTLCGDKVAAVLAWTHSDPFVLPKSHDVPMLSQLLTDGQSSSFVAQRLTDGHVSIPVGGIDVCPSIDTQRHSRGSSARHRLRQRSGTLLHFAYDDARASGDHEDEVS